MYDEECDDDDVCHVCTVSCSVCRVSVCMTYVSDMPLYVCVYVNTSCTHKGT